MAEWTEEQSQAYLTYMESNVRYDHRRWAQAIARDWPDLREGATVVDVAGGPAFLTLELAPLLCSPSIIVTDFSATMLARATERAAQRGQAIEVVECPAERMALPDGCADLVVCKHFIRLATDVDLVLREAVRVLRPGGRAYFVDFAGDAPLLGRVALYLWIRATGPKVITEMFWDTMKSGMTAAKLVDRMKAAGFDGVQTISSGVSYLVRAKK